MAHKTGTVNVRKNKVKPETIHVKRADRDNGVVWTIPNKDYAFTYITFDKFADDFDRVVIRDNREGKSTLRVDDNIADLGDIKYTLYYIERAKPKKVLFIDPKIKNQ